MLCSALRSRDTEWNKIPHKFWDSWNDEMQVYKSIYNDFDFLLAFVWACLVSATISINIHQSFFPIMIIFIFLPAWIATFGPPIHVHPPSVSLLCSTCLSSFKLLPCFLAHWPTLTTGLNICHITPPTPCHSQFCDAPDHTTPPGIKAHPFAMCPLHAIYMLHPPFGATAHTKSWWTPTCPLTFPPTLHPHAYAISQCHIGH